MLFYSLSAAALLATTLLPAATAQPLQHVAGARPSNPAEPLQHRSAFAGTNGNAMRVQWNTYSQPSSATVYYGTTTDPSTYQTATGQSVTYNTSVTYTNTVLLSNLQPHTTYYWYAMNTNCSGCQQIPMASFRTALPAGSNTPFTFGLVGDMGLFGIGNNVSTPDGTFLAAGFANTGTGAETSYPNAPDPTHNTMVALNDTVTAGNIEFILHVGDIAYADEVAKILPKADFSGATYPNANDTLSSALIYEQISEAYFDQMQPITSQAGGTYMVVPGNHEATCSNSKNIDICAPGQLNFTGYNVKWAMPSNETGGVLNMFYSFNYGLAHFIMLNDETDYENSPLGPTGSDSAFGTYQDVYGQGPFLPPQVNNLYQKWIDQDLGSVNRSVTPWIIALLHRPWYLSTSDRNAAGQVFFEPLLQAYGVDLVYHGHSHQYERMTAIEYGGKPDPAGYNNPTNPVYLLDGAAGHYGGLDKFDGPQGYGGLKAGFPVDSAFQPYSRFHDDMNIGFGQVTIHNHTHMTYNRYIAANNSIEDSFTLYKAHDQNTQVYSTNLNIQNTNPAAGLNPAAAVQNGNPSSTGVFIANNAGTQPNAAQGVGSGAGGGSSNSNGGPKGLAQRVKALFN